MTIRKRLARSNLAMLLIPVVLAAVLLAAGGGLAWLLVQRVYLPRLGLTEQALHTAGEQLEAVFPGAKLLAAVYGGVVLLALLGAVAGTNFYLTRRLFRHISQPLDTLVSGVERIQGGNLDAPIAYAGQDEFKPACDAVDEMAARLRASLEAQQRQQQQKQELIAGMSHDLKSPLTSIRAYTEGLLDGVARDEAARQRYLQTIYAKEAELETLVNRLFAFARLELDAEPAQLAPVALRPALREITEGFDAEGLTVTLEPGPEAVARADRALLTRIVNNLLENSRKYGGHTPVHVTVSIGEADGLWALRFADDGPGVPPEQLEKIFELGYRTDSARQNPAGGSGLGLAVVRHAAGQMHGSVRAENGPAGGLWVTLLLPKEETYGEHSDH